MSLNLALCDGEVHKLSEDSEDLGNVIHAIFVNDLNPELVGETDLGDAAEVRTRIRKSDYFSLEDVVPVGDPSFLNAGHNGYTWKNARGKKIADRSYKIEDKLDSRFTHIMSEAFVGSGSNIFIPTLKTRDVRNPGAELPQELPKFMIFQDGMYVAAGYDTRTNSFIPIEEGQKVEPNALVLQDKAQQRSEYVKSYDHLSNPRPFAGEPFASHVFLHFSLKRKVLGKISRAYRQTLLSNEQVNKFSYATHTELKEAVGIIKKVSDQYGVAHIQALNKFLLYKSFERKDAKQGSYIVGQMIGDSQTIHLPYAQVGVRR
ncbi:hypothetical protein HN695_05535 [Candidatus Woesearchaeota archaeon]|jgi:hypothetical protein|nr:hypothetical protein [Candidatus Woesearchaeota archaeon]MBT5272200.1 hypothetical protein [Candidatus Woesearchaeota archaeon]MBT6041544.1 hypothetical protein [Candidatus Woesearchaeota archaeon]MBT6336906.1 hypothetical protein [Candidatus Woesearchaeota archaeon]MBT7927776.1 hypothetical protein [Candidatus Woesearchaeota archaeon]